MRSEWTGGRGGEAENGGKEVPRPHAGPNWWYRTPNFYHTCIRYGSTVFLHKLFSPYTG